VTVVPDPTYRLISEQSDVPRPRVLRSGSLADCLDELKEEILADVVRCNAGRLTIVADFSGTKAPVTVVLSTVTGDGY
jgi:hypothetical protein